MLPQIDEQMAGLKTQYPGEGEFVAALEAQGMTEEQLTADIKLFLEVKNFLEKEFYEKITATEDEALAYYGANSEQFTQEEQIRARHILMMVDQNADDAQKAEVHTRMEAVLEKARAGEDFAELAEEFSEGPSNVQGGDLGFFGPGSHGSAFQRCGFCPRAGEISDIVETQFGYHIIKLEEKKEGGMTPYEEVSEQIAAYLPRIKSEWSWMLTWLI